MFHRDSQALVWATLMQSCVNKLMISVRCCSGVKKSEAISQILGAHC